MSTERVRNSGGKHDLIGLQFGLHTTAAIGKADRSAG